MRYLPCLLLWVFPQVWGQSEPQQNYSFRCLQISSFTNSTCSSTDCLAWLGDLQTHRWSNASNTIRFVRPWSQGKLSNQEWEKLQRLFQIYRFSFTTDIKEMVKMVPGLHYPIEVQLSAGCEVYPENVLESYLHVAFQGEYVLSFQETYWKKAPEAPSWLEKPIEELNKDQGTRKSVQELLNDTCPQFVRGLLEKGKPDLEKQEKPVAWLSSGLSPAHGHLQLVCHVSGFYPKPIWVMWMRGDKEQQSTQRSDIVPNADGTWYLQATLDVEAGDAAGLACWVKHSSLGGQDIIRYWGGRQLPVGLVILIVMLVFLMAGVLICSAFVIWNRWHYQDVL